MGLHSANTHIIPASADVLRTLRQIRTNHYVELEGYLVNVVLEGTTLRISLSRTDSGAGACGRLYVTSPESIADTFVGRVPVANLTFAWPRPSTPGGLKFRRKCDTCDMQEEAIVYTCDAPGREHRVQTKP